MVRLSDSNRWSRHGADRSVPQGHRDACESWCWWKFERFYGAEFLVMGNHLHRRVSNTSDQIKIPDLSDPVIDTLYYYYRILLSIRDGLHSTGTDVQQEECRSLQA